MAPSPPLPSCGDGPRKGAWKNCLGVSWRRWKTWKVMETSTVSNADETQLAKLEAENSSGSSSWYPNSWPQLLADASARSWGDEQNQQRLSSISSASIRVPTMMIGSSEHVFQKLVYFLVTPGPMIFFVSGTFTPVIHLYVALRW